MFKFLLVPDIQVQLRKLPHLFKFSGLIFLILLQSNSLHVDIHVKYLVIHALLLLCQIFYVSSRLGKLVAQRAYQFYLRLDVGLTVLLLAIKQFVILFQDL